MIQGKRRIRRDKHKQRAAVRKGTLKVTWPMWVKKPSTTACACPYVMRHQYPDGNLQCELDSVSLLRSQRKRTVAHHRTFEESVALSQLQRRREKHASLRFEKNHESKSTSLFLLANQKCHCQHNHPCIYCTSQKQRSYD